MKTTNKNDDNYTYFLTSSDGEIIIEKLHLCTWMFHGEKEFLECGLQIRCDERIKESRKINLRLWIPWLTKNTKVTDLYPSLKEEENTRFIFNEGYDSSAPFDDAHSDKGITIKFTNGEYLCLLPVSAASSDGVLNLSITIPNDRGEDARLRENVYVRIMISAPAGMLSFKQPGIAKRIYSYDIKLNEPRNQPNSDDFHITQVCPVLKAYCLHIIPSSFSMSFLSNDTFKNVRLLEKNSYKKYVSKVTGDSDLPKNLGKDEFIVVFNKRSAKNGETNINPCSFFSVFEEESVGNTQVIIAIVLNYVCSMFFYWLSFSGQDHTKQLATIGAMGIILMICCWWFIRKQITLWSYVWRIATISIIIMLTAWGINRSFFLPTTSATTANQVKTP